MNLTINQNILLHVSSLAITIAVLIWAELSKIALLFALGLIFVNLRQLVKVFIDGQDSETAHMTASSPARRLASRQSPKFDTKVFEAKVREAFQKNANKKCAYFEEDNKYWHNLYFSKSDQIQQLKDVRLQDLRRQRVFKDQQDTTLRLQFSTIKKIRNYLQVRDADEKQTISRVRQWCEKHLKSLGTPFETVQLTDRQIQLCISVVEQYMTSKISNDYDQIVSDFNAVDKFLQRCFSVGLQIQPSSNLHRMITFAQLLDVVRQFGQKNILTSKLHANLSPLEIKKQIMQIRYKIDQLPNFSQPPNILRLALFLKHLRREFPEENLISSGVDTEARLMQPGRNHLFKFQENQRMFYNKVTSIKARGGGVLVLLFVINVWKSYYKSSKGIVKQIRSILFM